MLHYHGGQLLTYGLMQQQVWEESEKRERKKESVSRKKINARRVEKSRHTVSLQCFAVPEGRKVGSLTRRMRS